MRDDVKQRRRPERRGVFDDWIVAAERLHSVVQRSDRIVFPAPRPDDASNDYGDNVEADLSFRPRPPISEEFDNLTILEIYLVQYVIEHHESLGFRDVRGPFRRGPDVHLKRASRWIHAEVETRHQNYIKHGHDRAPAFSNVELLIVPEQTIAADIRDRLPKTIIHIARDRFVPWCEDRVRRLGAYDRAPVARSRLHSIIFGALGERIANTEVHELSCKACQITITFRVESAEPGFREPADRVDLVCPSCGALLLRARGVDSQRVRVARGVQHSTVASGRAASMEDQIESLYGPEDEAGGDDE